MISLTTPSESGADAGSPSVHFKLSWLLGLLVVWIVGGFYLWLYLDRGWVPHDEGTLAQSAERVLLGELPHRDFDEVYTGGLSYLHAAAFSVEGVRLTSIRWALFAGALLWLPAVFYIASRWTSVPVAVLMTLLAVTLSVPNYSAAIPSWYNLFLATLGIAAMLRFLETRSRLWLLAAGLCGGLSILAKIVGLYFVAGVGLTLIAWEQSGLGGRSTDKGRASEGADRLYPAVLFLGLALYVVGAVWTFGRLEPLRSIGAFVLPAVLPAVLLMEREARMATGVPRHRWHRLLALAAPFAAGVLVVLLPYLLYYALNGALSDLLRGLFVDPAQRLQFAAHTFPSLASIWTAIPPVALLIWASRSGDRTRFLIAAGLAGPLVILLLRAESIFVYQPVFYSFRWLVLLAVVAGAIVLRQAWYRGAVPASSESADSALFALVAVAGLCNLVQFPFAAPIYFLYVAPLGLLALIGVIGLRSVGPRPVVVTLAAFYMIFCAAWLNRGFIHWMGIHFYPDNQTELLDIDRGGLRVNATDKGIYEALTDLVREKARGEFIYATPDCPQVYFLSGYRNPTPTLFDFFDEPEGRVERILQILETKKIHLVVLNHKPDFSGPPPPDLLSALRNRFPEATTIGHFEVRWRS